MKVRIVEEVPGEVQARAEDVVRVLERLTGRDLLIKAESDAAPHKSSAVEHPAITQVVDRARAQHVADVKRKMDAKIAKVLGG